MEVDDARFEVVFGVDEGEGVGGAIGEGVGVARVVGIEDVGDCGERLLDVGTADVLVCLDVSRREGESLVKGFFLDDAGCMECLTVRPSRPLSRPFLAFLAFLAFSVSSS